MKLNVVFGNIYQGTIFAGKKDGRDVFFGYKPSLYTKFFSELNPDILCLAEMPVDDQSGGGKFRAELLEEFKFKSSEVYVNDKSWIVEDKFYASAIFSKYKFEDYEVSTLPNPKLEVDHADGSHWVMHNKALQKAVITVADKKINVFNLHYYPFHHFGRSVSEPEFAHIRQKLADSISPKADEISIVTGDFNNSGVKIEDAFPELFSKGIFKKAVEYDRREKERYYQGDGTQIDHILYSTGLRLIQSDAYDNYSDHCTISAIFEID